MLRNGFWGFLICLIGCGAALAQPSLPPLKAVLLVGPIDGDYGSWTQSEKENMDLAADELAAHGVEVHKLERILAVQQCLRRAAGSDADRSVRYDPRRL